MAGKIIAIVICVWVAFGAFNFIITNLNKNARQRLAKMSVGKGIVFTIVYVLGGPAVLILGFVEAVKQMQKKDAK